MIKKIKYFFLPLFCLVFWQTRAEGEITCETPRKYHRLVIRKKSVSIMIPKARRVASELHARTKLQGNGITKIVYLDGKKFTVHINDKDNFSESKDYLVIRSRDRHEITYPLSCTVKSNSQI